MALVTALQIVRCRLCWMRLCLREFLAWNLRRGHRFLFNRPDRLTSLAIERVQERLFRRLEHTGDAPSVDVHIHEHRRHWRVVVPDVVMHELVMPDTLAGLDVESEQGRAE